MGSIYIGTPGQEVAPALQRQAREGAERDSWCCLEMVSRNMKWVPLGIDSLEKEQREILGPVWID